MNESFHPTLLTLTERQLLLTHPNISESLKKQLMSVSPLEQDHLFLMEENELDEICTLAQDLIASIRGKKKADALLALVKRIVMDSLSEKPVGVEEEWNEIIQKNKDSFDRLPEDLKQRLAQIIQQYDSPNSYEAMEAVSRVFDDFTFANLSKRTGISEARILQLLDGAWNSPSSPIRLNWKLPRKLLLNSILLFMALKLVDYLNSRKGRIRLDKSGHISKTEMKNLLPTLDLNPEMIQTFRSPGRKTVSEWQLLPLYKARLALQNAELILLDSDSLQLTEKCISLLSSRRLGRVFVKLFRSFFQNTDLFFLLPEYEYVDTFQDYIPLFLYLFSQKFNDWVTAEDALPLLALDEIFPWDPKEKKVYYSLVFNCLIIPLVEFGLVETSLSGGDLMHSSVRKTPLFDCFIQFKFDDLDQKVIPLPLL